jgi:hypothetical protein
LEFVMTRAFAVAVAALCLCGAQASAQQLSVQLHGGFADVSADNVPLRAILEEWSRVGGVAISNADKTSSVPVTLTLTNVPEKVALATLLRGVSGYMLAPRVEGTGASAFSRILILPASTSPRPLPTASAQSLTQNPRQPIDGRFRPERDERQDVQLIGPGRRSVNAEPGDPEFTRLRRLTPADVQEPAPVATGMPAPPPGPASSSPMPAPSGANTTIGSVVGSSQPGVVTPAPAPAQPVPARFRRERDTPPTDPTR